MSDTKTRHKRLLELAQQRDEELLASCKGVAGVFHMHNPITKEYKIGGSNDIYASAMEFKAKEFKDGFVDNVDKTNDYEKLLNDHHEGMKLLKAKCDGPSIYTAEIYRTLTVEELMASHNVNTLDDFKNLDIQSEIKRAGDILKAIIIC